MPVHIRAWFAAALLVSFACLAAAQDPCGLEYNGQKFDFSALKNGDTGYQLKDSQGYNYWINLCGALVQRPPTCSDSGTQAVQVTDQGFCTDIAMASSVKWEASAKGEISVTYGDGKRCNQTPRTLSIHFTCGKEAGAPIEIVEQPTGSCHYSAQWATKYACAQKTGPQSPGGLSGGSIFLLIIIVTTTVYCVAGVLYNQRKGKMGLESVPNLGFWRTVPGLVKDGCTFTWSKISGRDTGKSGYDTVA